MLLVRARPYKPQKHYHPVIPNGVCEVRDGFASRAFCAMNPSLLGVRKTYEITLNSVLAWAKIASLGHGLPGFSTHRIL
jgi:hypothetical protein